PVIDETTHTRRPQPSPRVAPRRDRGEAHEQHRDEQQRETARAANHAVILARSNMIASRFMARTFTKCSLADAVARLRPGTRVLLPPGCGEPQALVGEICRQASRLAELTLLGGIHLGDYPWARTEHAALRFAT